MKQIAVIGGMGNMGKRYRMILEKYTEVRHVVTHDILWDNRWQFDECDGFIIATPSSSHVYWIMELAKYGKPILCDKPVCDNIHVLKNLILSDIDLSMINQYEFITDKEAEGDTHYNYFKTGNDGLYWDCINIIGLAKGAFTVADNSLIWDCKINGQRLNINKMDYAYIRNIVAWVKGWRNKDYILDAHKKVVDLYDQATKRY